MLGLMALSMDDARGGITGTSALRVFRLCNLDILRKLSLTFT